MATGFRKLPPICLVISLLRLLSGKLKYTDQFIGDSIRIEDGEEFTIFRHISSYPLKKSTLPYVFIVRFKFAKLSHKANEIASKIPMLLITGQSGFTTKMYAVNHQNGYWQGMYQWESKEVLEEYKKSFVYKMMNKRAINSSLKSKTYNNQSLIDFIEKLKLK